jgi:hypothetical protein
MGLLGVVQLRLLTGHDVRALPDLLATGDYDADLLGPDNEFTATHLFRRAALVGLLASNGLCVDRVTDLEGPLSPLHDAAIGEHVADREATVETVDRLRTDPAVADFSVHMLAVGAA